MYGAIKLTTHSVSMFYTYVIYNLKGKVMRAALFASVIIMTLVGCGGGGSGSSSGGNIGSGGESGGENSSADSDSAPSETTAASVAGATADGYLVGANVCLDTDADNSCSGEATITTSTEGGAFEISGATEADFAQYPLLTEIVEDVTTDADRITEANPTGVIGTGEGFVLASPPGLLDAEGKAFISPITSLVENQRLRAIANGQSPSDALASGKAAILALIGDVDLTADYIAASASGDEAAKAAAERIHILARAVTGLLADAKQEVAAAIANGDLTAADTAAMFSVAINQIVKQVSTVVSDVETALVSINSTEYASDAARATALSSAIAQIVTDNDVVDAATLPGLVAVDSVAKTALTAREMLLVDGGVWIGEVDVEVEKFVQAAESGETSTVVIENIFVGFENLGIIENGETSTGVLENGETSTSVIENGETSTNVLENGETSTSVLENGETSSLSFIDEYVLSPLNGLIFERPFDSPFLAADGWTDSSGPTALVVEDDGAVSCDGDLSCNINSVVRIDLEDKDVADTMALLSEDGALWRRVLIEDISFGVGATGYIATISAPESYELDNTLVNPFFDYVSLSDLIVSSDVLTASIDIYSVKTFQVSDIGGAFVIVALGDDEVAHFYSGDLFQLSRVGSVAYRSFNLNGESFIEISSVELPFGTIGTTLITDFGGSVYTVDFEKAENARVLLLDTDTNQTLIDAIDGDKLPDPYYFYD
jgi:hypothetical protein